MNGIFSSQKSSETQSVFTLENGCSVTIEYNQSYGEFVKRIDDKDGYWCASSGIAQLPGRFGWAMAWAVPKRKAYPDDKWIVPQFNKTYRTP